MDLSRTLAFASTLFAVALWSAGTLIERRQRQRERERQKN